MSYDIRLVDKDTGEVLYTDKVHNFNGNTYAENGTTELWINYSYNYRKCFQQYFGPDGIHFLQGRRSCVTWSKLVEALEHIANTYDITKHSPDPWDPYPADGYEAIKNILNLGMLAPDGIWNIS